MKNYIIFFSVFINFFTIYSQEFIISDSDSISWEKENKLKWGDFSGKIDKEIGLKKAVACTAIVLSGNFIENEMPTLIIKAFFIKSCSWTVTNKYEILQHEQLHFDIAELFSRRIRKKFQELKNENEFDINVYINVYNRFLEEEQLFQTKYDSEVYFNKEKQKEWILNINELLNELEEFEN